MQWPSLRILCFVDHICWCLHLDNGPEEILHTKSAFLGLPWNGLLIFEPNWHAPL